MIDSNSLTVVRISRLRANLLLASEVIEAI